MPRKQIPFMSSNGTSGYPKKTLNRTNHTARFSIVFFIQFYSYLVHNATPSNCMEKRCSFIVLC